MPTAAQQFPPGPNYYEAGRLSRSLGLRNSGAQIADARLKLARAEQRSCKDAQPDAIKCGQLRLKCAASLARACHARTSGVSTRCSTRNHACISVVRITSETMR